MPRIPEPGDGAAHQRIWPGGTAEQAVEYETSFLLQYAHEFVTWGDFTGVGLTVRVPLGRPVEGWLDYRRNTYLNEFGVGVGLRSDEGLRPLVHFRGGVNLIPFDELLLALDADLIVAGSPTGPTVEVGLVFRYELLAVVGHAGRPIRPKPR